MGESACDERKRQERLVVLQREHQTQKKEVQNEEEKVETFSNLDHFAN